MKIENCSVHPHGYSKLRFSSSSIFDCHDILREILSRLPVKSLSRFKCVSKHWQCLICLDRDFIDLHFTRSKQQSRDRFIIVPRHDKQKVDTSKNSNRKVGCHVSMKKFSYQKYFLLSKLFTSRPLTTTVTNLEQKSFYTQILNPVNGLICLVNHETSSVCILNPSTREQTPWIACQEYGYFSFGFDPTTKRHKVICIWRSGKEFCEVLTVGENRWRVIKTEVSINSPSFNTYSNGYVYWSDSSLGIPEFFNAFDVGCEKFKVIKIPKEAREKCVPEHDDYGQSYGLIEVGGHIGLLRRWTSTIFKLWICEDDTCNGSYSKWTEITLELPFQFGHVKGSRLSLTFFHSIAREDRIIIECHTLPVGSSHKRKVDLYSYDWKNKTTKKVKSGEVLELISASEFGCASTFRSFTESLWPVRDHLFRENEQNPSITGKRLSLDDKDEAPSDCNVKKSKTKPSSCD